MQPFDPGQATARLIDSLGPEVLARSEAYTRGANLLVVAGAVLWVAIAVVAVRSGAMARLARLWPARPRWQATIAAIFVFFVVADLIRLPWSILADWWFARRYGLSSQALGDFIGQTELSSLLGALVSALFFAALFGLIRRSGPRWWVAAGGITAIGITVMFLLGPILLLPLFNSFQPVPQGPVRVELERLAERTGIPHERIYMYDGSRQSGSFTANVSGIGPAAFIAISDVALRRASLDEVRVVTAHEAGHYMLGHVWRNVLVLPLLAVLVFALISRLYPRAAALMGSQAKLGEVESLPVVLALGAVLSLLVAPVLNSLTRVAEYEADRYALQTTGLPDALASALLKTVDYRYPRPGSLEETLFYSHPSLERRIRAAMDWKAQHLPQATAVAIAVR